MVDALDILAGLLIEFQIADGLDLTGCHLHEHTGAPLGDRLDAHLVEFVLDDVLQLDVDGRGDVISLDGRDTLGPDDTVGQLDVPGYAGTAIEQRVQCHFQAGMAVDAGTRLVLAHIADTARGHVAVGLDAAVVLLGVEAVLILGTAQEGELPHALILLVGEHVGEEFVGAVFLAFLPSRAHLLGSVEDALAVAQDLLLPLGGCHRVVKYGKAVAERADVLHQAINLDTLGEPVDAQHIVLQVSGQHRAVIGQQLAALGLDGRRAGEHRVGLLVPLGSLHDCGLEQVPRDCGREEQHQANHDGIARKDMSFVVLFHCLQLTGEGQSYFSLSE